MSSSEKVIAIGIAGGSGAGKVRIVNKWVYFSTFTDQTLIFSHSCMWHNLHKLITNYNISSPKSQDWQELYTMHWMDQNMLHIWYMMIIIKICQIMHLRKEHNRILIILIGTSSSRHAGRVQNIIQTQTSKYLILEMYDVVIADLID